MFFSSKRYKIERGKDHLLSYIALENVARHLINIKLTNLEGSLITYSQNKMALFCLYNIKSPCNFLTMLREGRGNKKFIFYQFFKLFLHYKKCRGL